MKSLLVVFLCGLVVDYSLCLNKKDVKLPSEAAGPLILAIQQCMAGPNSVAIEDLLKVYQGGYSEDKKFKEFIFCCYKNAGYLNPDGTINTEKSAKNFKNNPVVLEGITRCSQETGKNAKESVFNYFKCFQDTVPVRFTL